MAILTGQGTAHAAATIMALGLDPRFDFSHAYWIIAGIAGGSPDRISLGSAAWARWVVDGDLGYEIDPREIPQDWSTGYVPLRKTRPFEPPAAPLDGQVYELNAGLAQWALTLHATYLSPTPTHSRRFARSSTALLRSVRPSSPSATKSPHPPTGTASSPTPGPREWVSYFTGGKGQFVTTAMEDTGTLQSLKYLAQAGRVDWQRILVLRTVSNFDQQPRGMTAAESLAHQRVGTYSAYLPSLEAAYKVGHEVVNALLAQWPRQPATTNEGALQ